MFCYVCVNRNTVMDLCFMEFTNLYIVIVSFWLNTRSVHNEVTNNISLVIKFYTLQSCCDHTVSQV